MNLIAVTQWNFEFKFRRGSLVVDFYVAGKCRTQDIYNFPFHIFQYLRIIPGDSKLTIIGTFMSTEAIQTQQGPPSPLPRTSRASPNRSNFTNISTSQKRHLPQTTAQQITSFHFPMSHLLSHIFMQISRSQLI